VSATAPEVVAVVVNWNGVAHLAECLDSLLAQRPRPPSRVVVVDNGSTDGSREVIAGYGAAVTPIFNDGNRGFAEGSNQGIELGGGELVALLNNDAVADPGWLAALVAALGRHPQAGSCTSRILSHADREVFDNVGHVLFRDGLTRGRGRLERDAGQYDREEEVFCASGCACLLRRSMLDDVGLFDESFFAYCEDADLGFRARLRGWSALYVPDAVAYHRFSASTEAFSPLKALNVERNRAWLAVKNLPLPLLAASLLHTLHRYLWQAWGALSARGASGRFVASRSAGELALLLVRAHREALAGLPGAWRQRRIIQRRRKVPIAEILSWFRRFGVGAREIALME
jgi:GT2 family glycosyltransferase